MLQARLTLSSGLSWVCELVELVPTLSGPIQLSDQDLRYCIGTSCACQARLPWLADLFFGKNWRIHAPILAFLSSPHPWAMRRFQRVQTTKRSAQERA